ncbi:hypothetical protein LWI28_011000 [Acer negundo]|uniref:PPPDE domain-containing protein n=1 Tax=Acer negundo TaxID=4023 RepID=A0AAD5JFK1_ACENE|nr:hypothetical protein LWI28_011000 [Acer negundo]KAK4858984.1 hypothetical protein QYF36_024860 [Acer negundo]
MLCRKHSSFDEKGSVPVHLNVYDLTPMNGYAYWLGLGVYHSGVQVHGIEYAFGAHEYPTTGIFEGEPKQCEGFTFRKTILIGKTDMGPTEVRTVMEELLTANPIPSWVNRLARIGFLCNCVLPVTLNSTNIQHHRIEDKPCEGEKKKLTSESESNCESESNRFASSNSSSSSPYSAVKRGRSRSRQRALAKSPRTPR